MKIASDFDCFHQYDAQAGALQRPQLFGDKFFVGEILLTPEIDLHFRLDEAGEQKHSRHRKRAGAGEAPVA